MFSALSYFLPAFGEGNTWQAIAGASVVLWLVHALVLSGVQQAAFVNLIATVAKIAPIILFIGIAVVAFRIDLFALDFSGTQNTSLGSIMAQVKSTMLVTLWVFIGIEGASVYSSRAERRQDIGAATMLGFAACLAMYALVSLLSLGIINQPELAALKNPSMAGVLEHIVGPWGAIVINVALVVSVLGAFLSWTLLAAEVPYVAAKDGTMPRFFAGENASAAPAVSLWVTNGLVQAFLLITYFANSTYQALFSIASVAILVPYVFSGAYAARIALSRDGYGVSDSTGRDLAAGAVATLYGVWLVYAADPKYLFMAAMLYAPGIVFYVLARRETGEKVFTLAEAVIAAALIIAACAAAWLLWTGAISPLATSTPEVAS
jgi:arginine:ornithine antiporter/lysine permease